MGWSRGWVLIFSCVACFSCVVVVVGLPCEYGPHAAEEPLRGVEPNDTHTMTRLQAHLGGRGCTCVEMPVSSCQSRKPDPTRQAAILCIA